MADLRIGPSVFSLLVLFAVLMALAGRAGAGLVELDDDKRFTRLIEPLFDEEGRLADFNERADLTLARFAEMWSDEAFGDELEGISEEVILLRLRAAETAAFYGPEPWVLGRLRSVIEVANERGLAEPAHFRGLFDAYLVAWKFDAAQSLRQSHSDAGLPEVPELLPESKAEDDQARIVWHVRTDPPRLEGAVVDLDGPRLLVVTSPGCGFSRRAVRTLADDEVLGPLMSANALWIAGPMTGNTFHYLAQWNEAFPDAPTVLVDDPGQWPVPAFDSYPGFYFIADEQVVAEAFGWAGGAQALQVIADGFIKLGLLDSRAVGDDAFAYADDNSAAGGCAEREAALVQSNERAPISTSDELDAYVAGIDAGIDSPLLALGEEARSRLVSSVSFGSRGVSGFRHDDLEAQLEPEGFYRAVSLFGMQYSYAGHFFPVELLSDEERDLRDRINCAGEYAQDSS